MTEDILILGKGGQVGEALAQLYGAKAIQIGSDTCDFTSNKSIASILDAYPHRVCINAAAYTQVDQAEISRARAIQINALRVKELAAYAKAKGTLFVHYSTDYVYDGQGNEPRKETHAIAPLNAYGRSKAWADGMIEQSGCDYLIIRTSWVYASRGNNFLRTMLKLAKQRDLLKIVDDQIGAPTYAPQLAKATQQMIEQALQSPDKRRHIIHCCNAGETSWFGFAENIMMGARVCGDTLKIQSLQPIPTSQYPTAARRPLNSRLDCSRLQALFGITMPHWQDGLNASLEEIYAHY